MHRPAALAAILVALLPAPARAAPPPESALTLTVTTDDGVKRTATLTCGPAGGDHPAAVDACLALEGAQGDLDGLDADTGMTCDLTLASVKATANGHWQGTAVDFNHEYLNPCYLARDTGPVFRLADVPLPG